ncbi:oxidoreductase, partial [Streptomyces sp. NPDC003832]
MTTSIETTSPTARPDAAAELVARAVKLQPLLRANAAQGERDRRVTEESIHALQHEGLFKVLQPRRYGGSQASMRALVDVSAAVGVADGGTAWV